MMSYIIRRMPCEGCYRISIFLAFWYGREKAIQVKPRAIWSNKLLVDSYFFENKGKNSPCLKIWGYVCTHSLPRRVRHAFLPHAWRTPKNVPLRGRLVLARPNKEIDNFAHVARFLVHFFAVTARLPHKVTRLRLTNWSRRRRIEYFSCHRHRG